MMAKCCGSHVPALGCCRPHRNQWSRELPRETLTKDVQDQRVVGELHPVGPKTHYSCCARQVSSRQRHPPPWEREGSIVNFLASRSPSPYGPDGHRERRYCGSMNSSPGAAELRKKMRKKMRKKLGKTPVEK